MTIEHKYNYQIETGTAQAGASSTITLRAAASGTDDTYNGCVITITGGAGNGQRRLITDYAGSTKIANVDSAWAVQPNNTSVYDIRQYPAWYNGSYPTLDAQRLNYDSTDLKAACDQMDALYSGTMQVGVNADMVDGAHAGTVANNVLKLDSNGHAPVSTVPSPVSGSYALSGMGAFGANDIKTANIALGNANFTRGMVYIRNNDGYYAIVWFTRLSTGGFCISTARTYGGGVPTSYFMGSIDGKLTLTTFNNYPVEINSIISSTYGFYLSKLYINGSNLTIEVKSQGSGGTPDGVLYYEVS
jgi:hypothetical protein